MASVGRPTGFGGGLFGLALVFAISGFMRAQSWRMVNLQQASVMVARYFGLLCGYDLTLHFDQGYKSWEALACQLPVLAFRSNAHYTRSIR
jgi:hypothetical protein